MSVDKDTSRLEDALKIALRRQQPPDEFADRVLARAITKESGKPASRLPWLRIFTRPIFAQPVVRWATAAALVAALVGGGIYHRHVQRQRAEGEAAKQQLILALRIAGSKLQLAKSKVQHVQDQTENQEEKE